LSLVPPPRAHLTRFHGIFAPNANLRAQLTPSVRGKDATADANADLRTPDERRRSMTGAQRLKRVFGIDVETCVQCGGKVKIVASVEEPDAIRAIRRPPVLSSRLLGLPVHVIGQPRMGIGRGHGQAGQCQRRQIMQVIMWAACAGSMPSSAQMVRRQAALSATAVCTWLRRRSRPRACTAALGRAVIRATAMPWSILRVASRIYSTEQPRITHLLADAP
jgi:hypothetical protein